MLSSFGRMYGSYCQGNPSRCVMPRLVAQSSSVMLGTPTRRLLNAMFQ